VLSVASLLPDIDYPKSWIGRVFFFASGWLERRFGHRTVTHSALGCVFFALLSLPLLIFSKEIYYLLLAGYFSHVVLDMFNKNGVPFFWPLREYIFVIPGRRSWRVEVGSRGEVVVLVLFFIASVVLYHFQGMGFYRMLHLVVKDISYARDDFIKYSSSNFTTLRGKFRDNATLGVNEAEYPVVATFKDGLIVLNNSDLKSVSKFDSANLYPFGAVLEVKEPMRSVSSRINLEGKTIGDLINSIDQKVEHYILGDAVPATRPPRIPDESDAYNPLYMSGASIRFYYATAGNLKPFSDMLLKRGQALVQYRLRPFEDPPRLDGYNSGTGTVETPLRLSVRSLDTIKVKVGDEVEKGHIIAEDPN
jgi:inner membrane protein